MYFHREPAKQGVEMSGGGPERPYIEFPPLAMQWTQSRKWWVRSIYCLGFESFVSLYNLIFNNGRV